MLIPTTYTTVLDMNATSEYLVLFSCMDVEGRSGRLSTSGFILGRDRHLWHRMDIDVRYKTLNKAYKILRANNITMEFLFSIIITQDAQMCGVDEDESGQFSGHLRMKPISYLLYFALIFLLGF